MKRLSEIVDMKEHTMELKRAFMDACSDPLFSTYAYDLGIKEEVMIKYTSSLKDCFNEKLNCEKCNSLHECKNRIRGYCYTPSPDSKGIVFSYAACNYEIKTNESLKYAKNITFMDMPKEVKNASFSNIFVEDRKRTDIVKFFQSFVKKYMAKENVKGLYLSGSFGSGKTYMISALFNELSKKEINSVIVYYPELLRTLKESFQDNYKEIFYTVKSTPLLLLDDIGAENVTAWGRDEVLGPILQYRMDEKLPTFFTSNLTMEQLEKHLSVSNNTVDKLKARRIIERIRNVTDQLELVSDNRRG